MTWQRSRVRHGATRLFHEVDPPRSRLHKGAYGRLFRNLPPFRPPSSTSEKSYARRLAKRMLKKGQSEDFDSEIPAAYTYFGQFLTHDLTFDGASLAMRANDPNRLQNFRTPRLDLDSVYGRGPDGDPWLYGSENPSDPAGEFFLRTGLAAYDHEAPNDKEPDLPRASGRLYLPLDSSPFVHTANVTNSGDEISVTPGSYELADLGHVRAERGFDHVPVRGANEVLLDGGKGWSAVWGTDRLVRLDQTAVIGDPRNDENIIVSQLHLAFLRFHNAVLREISGSRSRPLTPEQAFIKAQQSVRWHYQWIVLHDYLPRIVGDDIIGDVLDRVSDRGPLGLRHFRWHSSPFIPIEFSLAAFRFGHSMARPRYRLNATTDEVPLFTSEPFAGPRDDLRGFRRLPSRWSVQWDMFLPIRGSQPQYSAKIDTGIAPVMASLPDDDDRSLPERTFVRGFANKLPSGGAVAAAMGIEPADGLNGDTPLWHYVLAEAETCHHGKRLGPVGATIVAEVLVGLVLADEGSFLNVHPKWQPVGITSLSGLMAAAGMPIDRSSLPFAVPGTLPEGPSELDDVREQDSHQTP